MVKARLSLLPVGLIVFAALGQLPFPAGHSSASTPAAASPAKARMNIEELSQPGHEAELQNLRHAFEVLVARSLKDPDDPTGYIHLADFHNDDLIGPCDHGDDIFLAWHRRHLLEFEKALQNADPNNPVTPTKDVMLPYWDWTTVPSGRQGYPALFESKTVDGTASGAPNIFYWPNPALCKALGSAGKIFYCNPRNAHPAGVPPYSQAEVDKILQNDWPAFTANLETKPHNTMHGRYVGSDMGDNQSAAYDPIFWFFHANIDRLLEQWQQTKQKDQCEAAPDPAKMPCLDCDVRGSSHWPPTGKVREFICIDKLGYKYDQLGFALTMAAARMSGRAAAAPQDVLAAPDHNIVAGPGTTVSLTFKAPSEKGTQVTLRLDDVTIPTDISYEVRVYLHPASVKFRRGDRTFAQKYYADAFVLWALHHKTTTAAAHHQTTDLSLDITGKMAEVGAANAGKDWLATFVFTPIKQARPANRAPLESTPPHPPSFAQATIVVQSDGKSKEIKLNQR